MTNGNAAAAESRTTPWLAYLRLFRLPNVFTAIGDVAMGYLVTTQSVGAWTDLVLLVAASSLMYTSGMVLNDVFDFEVDARERPHRPLPSGQISRERASSLGWGFLASGWLLGCLAGIVSPDAVGPWWRSAVVATLLAGSIVLYDGVVKQSIAGPLVMGACRGFNVLLGMSLNAAPHDAAPAILGWGPAHLLIAAGIAVYITGVTVFARSEATRSPRGALILGAAVMASGVAFLALFPGLYPHAYPYRIEPATNWPLVMLVTSIWILRRCVLAITNPIPRYVQSAVKFSLLSLIVLDATLCLLVCPPAYAFGVLALLIPTLILGRWVYST
jgi:4-hydroxybenzoate polyprenyltransferase